MENKQKNRPKNNGNSRNGSPRGENRNDRRTYNPQQRDDRRFRPAPAKASEIENDSPQEGIHGDYENGAVIGRNAVRELLKADRPLDKLLVQKGERSGSIVVLVAQAIEKGIPVVETDKNKLDAMSGFVPHQGIIAMASEKEYCTVDDILNIASERGEAPLIVIADGITDPYNLGALIRCAEGAGAHGIIIPKRRSTGLTPLVSKSSAGAIEHMAIAKVANISNTIRYLKEKGVWIFAAEAGGKPYYETDFKGPCGLVFGSEGNGVSQIVIENSDALTSIPMYGKVNSFNVSTAASVILCEAARQNRTK